MLSARGISFGGKRMSSRHCRFHIFVFMYFIEQAFTRPENQFTANNISSTLTMGNVKIYCGKYWLMSTATSTGELLNGTLALPQVSTNWVSMALRAEI